MIERRRDEIQEELKGHVDSVRSENYKILSVFTALISFLFGSVKLFGSKEYSVVSVLTNVAILGMVLALFMGLFPFYTIQKKRGREIYYRFFYTMLGNVSLGSPPIE